MNRKEFIKTAAIDGATLNVGSAGFLEPIEPSASGKYEMGQCKSVRITCISETAWYDNARLMDVIKKAGGVETNQWRIPWDQANAAGVSSLIDIELVDGSHRKILMDTGWNREYMDACFKREGIDAMLRKGEIEMLFISHEHMDHYMGLESVLRHNPKIRMIIPGTFLSEGMQYLKGADVQAANTQNGVVHTGELWQLQPSRPAALYPGCAAVAFDVPTILGIRGEQSLFFNIRDKGIVCVTGCCHQTLPAFADFAREKIAGGERLYGVYGGLHIAPFGGLDAKGASIVEAVGAYGFRKIACNHCTGKAAVEEMVKRGYPIVRGSGKNGSSSDLYIGNGDQVMFG